MFRRERATALSPAAGSMANAAFTSACAEGGARMAGLAAVPQNVRSRTRSIDPARLRGLMAAVARETAQAGRAAAAGGLPDMMTPTISFWLVSGVFSSAARRPR